MNIDDYNFGKITVDGQTYTSDVVITQEGVTEGWRRKEGHRLDKADLDEILTTKPDCLLIGTGYYGCMSIPAETIQYLQEKKIQLHYAPTSEAIRQFSKLQQTCARLVMALHLTC